MKHNKNYRKLTQLGACLSNKEMLRINGGAKKPPPIGLSAIELKEWMTIEYPEMDLNKFFAELKEIDFEVLVEDLIVIEPCQD